MPTRNCFIFFAQGGAKCSEIYSGKHDYVIAITVLRKSEENIAARHRNGNSRIIEGSSMSRRETE